MNFFNDGSCVHPRNITGIEIENGKISLIKWLIDTNDDGVLQIVKEYIERDFKVIYGILTKPAVYNLSAKGRKYIRQGYRYYLPNYLRKFDIKVRSNTIISIKQFLCFE